jgi:flavin reductase (DIM6/NTAB) family NADH-FMN oxidoreductase RutF
MRKSRPHGDIQAGLKKAMRLFPQGVTVVTVPSADGPRGITVSSFTSVSLDPPLVLVSIARSSELHDSFASAKSFAVNFLADDQKLVSDQFAGRVRVGNRFDEIKSSRGSTGSPIINGALAAIECYVWRVYDGGDHSIILGKVVDSRTARRRRPLVYYDRQYTTIERSERAAPLSDMVV